MSASDFDDIFGDDLKMDATGAPTLTNVDLDDDDLFGGEPSGKMAKPAEAAAGDTPQSQANWAQIGGREQDEFLSWLDDGPSQPGSASSATTDLGKRETPVAVIPLDAAPPPVPVIPVATAPAPAFDSVSLDDDDDFDRIVQNAGKQTEASAANPIATDAASSNVSLDDDDDDLERIVQNANKHTGVTAPIQTAPIGTANISLDNDDDDDDLEQIVKKANKQSNASGSRENSSSSLQIKSQVQAQHKSQKVDVIAVRQVYQETGELPARSRLTLWQRAVQPGSQDSASMYAVQTTSRTLPSQALLRKEVEALCSRIFASAAHARVLREVGDSMRGTHLLFIDSAETLLTHLCHQFDIDYVSGTALTFAPLLVASGSEPLHPEIVETLAATCRRFVPHIAQKLPIRAFAAGRRPLLKRLLLYHAPQLASHLQENFPTWNNAPPEEYDAASGGEGSGAIPDSWLASFFESDAMASDPANFDFLLRVWDCSLLLEAFSSNESTPLSTGSYIIVYAMIAAEKALLRMQGEQLRHCMASTLTETLLRGEATKDAVFACNIRQLMHATPPCFYTKLRSAGLPPSPVIDAAVSGSDTLTSTAAASNTSFGMNSLLTASTQGVKDLSNLMIDMPVKLMIDMPVKLLTMVPLNPMAALSSPTSTSLTDSPETQQLFYLHVQAMEVAAVSVTLDAKEVIPSVFGGIQGHDTPEAESIRYFIIDCRGPEDKRGGQVPTALHFDPDAVADPILLDQILATLNPLKSAGVHICVMGQGYAHIAEELRQFQQKNGVASSSPFSLSEGFLETYANDQTRVQSTIEFLLKHNFPRVSLLDGGYVAAHGHLFRSHSLTVDDLADHDTPHCLLCQHDRSMQTTNTPGNNNVSEPRHVEEKESAADRGSSFAGRTASSRTIENVSETAASGSTHGTLSPEEQSGFTDINLSPATTSSNPVKSPSSYYSSFAGALKTGGKTILSPTMDGTKWLMKKSAATTAEFANAAASMGNMSSKTRTGSLQGVSPVGKTSDSPSVNTAAKPSASMGSSGMQGFNKLRNSIVSIGSESVDMLKKMENAVEHAVEQAAVATTATTAKFRVPFPSTISPSSKEAAVTFSPPTSAKASPVVNNSPSKARPDAPRATLSSDPTHSGFFHQSTDEMFTIDDDDDDEDNEGHFVQDVDSRSTSSFQTDSPISSFGGAAMIHDVAKGHVDELRKGMMVSRAQMLPCVSSPFFACYKKKPPVPGAPSHSNAHARRLVLMENHIVVLKSTTRNEDDVYMVKSCHPLGHVARMTCLKKNALMVSIYYKWKAIDGQIIERRNSYEVQQRDDFIKAVKTTMDKM
ncbi:hypothetical protein PHYBOEH_009456 [Phytophthora boehmeriae]|uniref:TBC1 domain family member 23 n=1 Tax=Phytophthora boehmeriae TaxID=109152 RepID=A0A8T1X7S8_9STRA|nr:hypothetical protein PHYBOEH_009456 [Phytophthora boehmeriae]